MTTKNFWKSQPRTGHSRFENTTTQPLRVEKAFNNPDIVLEGWYPLCKASDLKSGEARSFIISKQRVAVWRGEDGNLRALDAFCPHMGADLGNGDVVGNELRCYFHHWRLNEAGQVTKAPCAKKNVSSIATRGYPVQEYLGHVWIFSGEFATSPLIAPPGLENKSLHAFRLLESTLFAHHHVMMAGGIDLQHFSTVHNIDIDFGYEFRQLGDSVIEWKMSGPISSRGWRGKVGRFLIGPTLTYRMRVGAGSMVSITYGENQRLLGNYFQLPQLRVLWGCLPTSDGVSKVVAFSVTEKKSGIFGRIRNMATHLMTLALLVFLRDDDVKAFPNMRFHISNPTPEDKPVLELIHAINKMPESVWTTKPIQVSKSSALNIGL